MADGRNIFDIIGSGVDKVLGNPFVQGAGIAAATGFSPLLGLIAGPIIKDDRERAKLENDEMRERIASARDQRTAAADFQNLVTSMRPMAARPGAPLGIMDLEGGIMAETPGRPGVIPSQTPLRPALETDQGRAEAMGLLGRMAPGAVASQLSGALGGDRPPADVAILDKIAQLRSEGRIEEANMLASWQERSQSNDPMEQILAMLQIRKLTEDIEAGREDRDIERTTREQNRLAYEDNLTSSLDQLAELGSLNQTLESTYQRPGLPGTVPRRTVGGLLQGGGDILGIETPESDVSNAAADLFSKTASNISFDILKNEEVPSNAQRILERFFAGTPSLEIDPAANYKIIADQIRGRLRLADQTGVAIPQERRAYYEALADVFEERSKQALGQGSGDADATWSPEGGVQRTK